MATSKKPNYLRALIAWSLPNFAAASAATGDNAPDQAATEHSQATLTDKFQGVIEMPNRIAGPDLYAMHASHSSHSSHASHSSHSSHYSGSGSDYSGSSSGSSSPSGTTNGGSPTSVSPVAPAAAPVTPTYVPSPTPAPLAAPAHKTTTPAASFGCASQEGLLMAMRVQTALKQRNLYFGPIDGIMGAKTKASVIVFQGSQMLPQTGKLDNATLAKLGIIC